MQKCFVIDCENQGDPEDGQRFYLCNVCSKEIDRLITEKLMEKLDELHRLRADSPAGSECISSPLEADSPAQPKHLQE